MADDAPEQDERTEEATPQRREQAREKGQIARSRDLVSALTLLAGIAILAMVSEKLSRALAGVARDALGHLELARGGMPLLLPSLHNLMWAVFPVIGGTTLVAAVVTLAQTGVPHPELLIPDLSRLNPVARLGQLFGSGMGGWELIKTTLKLGGLFLAAWHILAPVWVELGRHSSYSPGALMVRMASLSRTLMLRLGLLLLGLAVLDYLMSRRRIERQMRMSRREVREELRHSEGNPQIKRRLRRKARELLRRRIAVEVPKADVVLVNPTHYAVALSYKPQKMRAPRVVAKGADHLAMRIRELARGAGVPVISNPPLARELHKRVAVGKEVPSELYRVVAEVLAFVYRIRAQRGGMPARIDAAPAGREEDGLI